MRPDIQGRNVNQRTKWRMTERNLRKKDKNEKKWSMDCTYIQ